MTIRFNVVEEFLDELEKDAAGNHGSQIDRGIVRLTNQYTPSRISSAIHHLSVVVTCVVAGAVGPGSVVRLDHLCGDVCGAMEHDQRTIDKATDNAQRIEAKARALGLSIRAGVIEDQGSKDHRSEEARP